MSPVRQAALLPLLLAGCNTGFAPQYLVTDLRLLAVRSEVVGAPGDTPSADADLGETVRLSALVANPRGRAPLTVTWATCLPTGTEALPACLDPALLRAPERLLASPDVVVLGRGEGLVSLDVAVPDLTLAIDALIARARAEPAYQCRLYAELPVVVIAEAEGRREIAVKRVRIAPTREVQNTELAGAYLVNLDPGVRSLELDPADEDACLGGAPVAKRCATDADCEAVGCGGDGWCVAAWRTGRATVCGRTVPSSVGPFNQCAPDGSRTAFFESLEWQWYATGGSFETGRTSGNATGSAVEFTRPSGSFTIWALVRDGRGGVGWLARDVPAAP